MLFHISFSLMQVIPQPRLARPWVDGRFKEKKAPSQPSSCSRSNERSDKSGTDFICGEVRESTEYGVINYMGTSRKASQRK